LIDIRVEVEYRSVARSLFERGPKRELDALIAARSEDVDSLKRLKLIVTPCVTKSLINFTRP
jgi:hypothetical protein